MELFDAGLIEAGSLDGLKVRLPLAMLAVLVSARVNRDASLLCDSAGANVLLIE